MKDQESKHKERVQKLSEDVKGCQKQLSEMDDNHKKREAMHRDIVMNLNGKINVSDTQLA